MRSRRWALGAGLGMTAFLFSCDGSSAGVGGGGGGGAGSCGVVAACGGDVVGTWQAQSACLDADIDKLAGFDDPACAGAVSNVIVMPDVMYTFTKTDVQVTGTMTLELSIRMSDRCVQALAGSTSVRADASFCSMLEQRYDAGTTMSIDSASCTAGPGACNCRVFSTPIDISSSGSYHVQGTTLVDDSGRPESYCVTNGKTLTLTSSSMSVSMSSSGASGTVRLVLTRR